MRASPENLENGHDWIKPLFEMAQVQKERGWKAIYEAMNTLAMRSAPVARSTWVWIVVVQGLSVLIPLLWLLRTPFQWSALAVAVLVLAGVSGLIVALWWLRWRGMQHTWARARLVAEVARACEAAALVPEFRLQVPALSAVPGLEALMKTVPASEGTAKAKDWPHWGAGWCQARIDDQMAFYAKAGEAAETRRVAFTLWTTRLLDLMLALAVAGLLVALTHRSPRWLRLLGEENLAAILGLGGAVLALGIILIQVLRSMQEVNRRAARFARQHEMLWHAKQALETAPDEAAALKIVQETEAQLLGEVVDWYFEAETAERFFQVKEEKAAPGSKHTPVAGESRSAWSPVLWGLAVGGTGLLFFVRVVLGRAPLVCCSCAATLGWLSYQAPASAESRQKLTGNGELLDVHGQAWAPDPARAANGCVVIAHGLHDGAFANWNGEESWWMGEMAAAVEERLIEAPPDIALVNWNSQAMPAELHGMNISSEQVKMALDVAGIRPQAREVGDYLAFRLAQWLKDGRIRRDKPLHLIGHSAGGFVVARAAKVLREINLAPQTMHVTILDTPGPDDELVVETPRLCGMDFYITSGFVLGLDDAKPPTGIHLKRVPLEKPANLLKAHSYAWEWYTSGIKDAKADSSGFGKSPLLLQPGGR